MNHLLGDSLLSDIGSGSGGVNDDDPVISSLSPITGIHITRSTSAPPVQQDGQFTQGEKLIINGEVVGHDDPRLSPSYYAYYYSQRPIDPRLPPPLLNCPSWQHSKALEKQQNELKFQSNSSVLNQKHTPTEVQSNQYQNQTEQEHPFQQQTILQQASSNNFQGLRDDFQVQPVDQPRRYGYEDSFFNNFSQNPKPSSYPRQMQPIPGLEQQLQSMDFDDLKSKPEYNSDSSAFGNNFYQQQTQYRQQSRHQYQQPSQSSGSPMMAVMGFGQKTFQEQPIFNSFQSQSPQSRQLAWDQQRLQQPPIPGPGMFRGSNNNRNSDNGRKEKRQHSYTNNDVKPKNDEIRNKTKKISEAIQNNQIAELASDQFGSRFIQQRLEIATDEEKEAIFKQLLPETLRLCSDVFGNYVIQKIFEQGLKQHKIWIAEKLEGSILSLSFQMYGCRVVQKAFEAVGESQRLRLASELFNHVLQCVRDQNGNHVIQKIIECGDAESVNIQFIVDHFKGNVQELSSHPYGCRVVQRLLEHCSKNQLDALLKEVFSCVLELVQNQYGNYVIQHILEKGTLAHKNVIVQALKGNIISLSKQKFASNVIEKCFQFANDVDRAAMIEELIGSSDITTMVRDQYGNYVVQKIVAVVGEPHRSRFVEGIKHHVPNLRKSVYGKHIIAKIESLTGKPFM